MKYRFIFKQGEEQRAETMTMPEARRTANEMADHDATDVRLFGYNEQTNKWELLGTYHGLMQVTDSYGCLRGLSNDFKNLI